MARIRVLIADDHTLFRAGIRSILKGIDERFEVVGEVSDGREALRLVGEYHPDVVLMDIAMPDISGLEATEQIRRDFPEVKVIILSMHNSQDFVAQALRAGAAGYLLKDAATQELEIALDSVAGGAAYLSPAISKQVVERYVVGADQKTEKDKEQDKGKAAVEALTPRQREVLELIGRGFNTKEIAYRLKVSPKTVEAHRAQLMERLGIRDTSGLVLYAVRTGLSPLGD